MNATIKAQVLMVCLQARKGRWVGRVGKRQELMTVGFQAGFPPS
jgi:hypothetical protein